MSLTLDQVHTHRSVHARLRGASLRIVLLWWALWAGAAAAQPLPLEDRAYGAHALMVASAILKDADGSLSIEEVRRLDAGGAFQPLRRLFGTGFVQDVYWLRLNFSRGENVPRDWWLRLDPPYLDDIRLYHVTPDGTLQPLRRGGDHAAPGDATPRRAAIFELDLAPGAHVAYLRVQTSSSLSLLPSLRPGHLAANAWLGEYLVLGGYFGAALAIVIASLFGSVLLRQRVYALFAVFVTCSALQWFAINGLAQQFLVGHIPQMADKLTFSLIPVTCAAGVVFFAHLFDYRRRHRWLYRVNVASAAYMVIAAVTPFVATPARSAPGVGALILLNLALMARPVWLLWRDGRTDIRVGVLAFLVYVWLVALNVASVIGLVPPSEFSLQGAQFGGLVQLFILMLAIFMHAMRSEEGRRQAESVAALAIAEHERERQARQEQSDLISMIAHEIRTPVAVIDAALQSLQVLDENLTPERELRHRRIARALERMNNLLEVALAQDRLEVSSWKQDLAPVDLLTLTGNTVDIVGGAAEERVTIHAPAGPCNVQADARMLRFALLNLIDNALKYSPKATKVEVSIEPMVHEGRPGLCWAVADRGRGLSAGDEERVFQKYVRAAEVSEAPGLGLGLYLVRQIVQRHQGWVRAVPATHGTGTRFECWLPCQPQEVTA